MRYLLRWPVLAVGALMLVCPQAGAQDEEVVAPEDQDTIEALPVEDIEADEGGGAESIQDGRTQVEEEHTVVPGDTLWDLCAKYLNNPWYWPRVWCYNPEIHNPHWIFPGQVVRFYPSGELPGEILAARDLEVPEPYEDETQYEEVPDQLVTMAGKAVQARRVTSVRIQRDAFVTMEEYEHLGKIVGSREDKKYLAHLDPIYIKFDNPGVAEVGKNYMIIRTKKKIHHPITGEFRGHYTRVLGAAQVVSIDEKVSTAIITSSLMAIERGDRVAAWIPSLNKNIGPRPNSVELKGYIMDSRVTLTNLGERHIVFIDQGSDQGVEEGNVFNVVRREDGYTELGEVQPINTWDKDLPVEIFGQIMVVDSRSQASTGIVLASLRELKVGDRVLMTVQ